jgi:hypothetical protein
VAKTCARCGETEGEPLGHDWQKATWIVPQTCTRCEVTEGDPLVPVLTEMYTGQTMRLIPAEEGERRWAEYGPGTRFARTSTAGGYLTDGDHSTRLTAYFIEGTWVFADIVHSGNNTGAYERYAYLPRMSVLHYDRLPVTAALDYVNGKTNARINPSAGPGEKYASLWVHKIPADTPVKVFFREGDYLFAEFSSSYGLVRLWLPMDSVDPVYE